MDVLTEQIRALAAGADDSAYRKIIDSIRELSFAIERPGDTVQRIVFGVWSSAHASGNQFVLSRFLWADICTVDNSNINFRQHGSPSIPGLQKF